MKIWTNSSSEPAHYSLQLWITTQCENEVILIYLLSCTGFLSGLAQHLRIINSLLCTISLNCTLGFNQKPQLLTIKSMSEHHDNTKCFRLSFRQADVLGPFSAGTPECTHKFYLTKVWQRGLGHYMVHITIIYDGKSLYIRGGGRKDLDFSFIGI